MDYLASMYIDDEMNLEEKKDFVRKVRDDLSFSADILELLAIEQVLRDGCRSLDPSAGHSGYCVHRFDTSSVMRMAGYVGLTFMVIIALLIPLTFQATPQEESRRFVLFEPQAVSVELVGSFSDWHPMAMRKIGDSGYWEINVRLRKGQHRYSYLVDEKNSILDPTTVISEYDDFGGKNSVLSIGEHI